MSFWESQHPLTLTKIQTDFLYIEISQFHLHSQRERNKRCSNFKYHTSYPSLWLGQHILFFILFFLICLGVIYLWRLLTVRLLVWAPSLHAGLMDVISCCSLLGSCQKLLILAFSSSSQFIIYWGFFSDSRSLNMNLVSGIFQISSSKIIKSLKFESQVWSCSS